MLISTQHREGLDVDTLLKPDLIEHVIEPILPERSLRRERGSRRPATSSTCNPTGKFVIGGPMGDSGLTGRKIIVDTYGGAAPHGGGAFSGKDPTKVDRSAAYAARYVAKNVVAAGLADRCQIQVAYAIGVAHPLSVLVETASAPSTIPCARSRSSSREHFDLRPAAILRDLDLRRPIYAKTAAYGHFGREDGDFTWERTDKADALRDAAGLAAANACDRGVSSERYARSDEEARRRPSRRDRPLAAVSIATRELTGRRLGGAHVDARARHEALVVEPVQEVAVVLGEADDRRARPGWEVASGASSGFSACSNVRVDGPAVRAAFGMAELVVDALDHVVGERVAELVGVHVRLGGRCSP